MRRKIHLFLLLFLAGSAAFSQTNFRNITADTKKIAGNKPTVFNECIGAGRANEGLRADWQQQLTMVQKDINFKYIRFHGLLNDDMGIYALDKDGKPTYNWQYIDKLFDFLQSIHIRPFVELSFMPADLASGNKTVFWWKGNVTQPKSYDLWDELIRQLVTHFQERYGKAEVEKWYFEVWNEPDLSGFFDGTQADYFKLYAHTAKAVKQISSTYHVGGPATSATKWIADFLNYCKSNKLPLDFVSTHSYSTTSVLDEFGTRKHKLKSDPDTVANDIKKVSRQVKNSAFKNDELHFTEWNTSPSSRDPIHDTYQNATFILNILKKGMPYTQSMSYWTFTDIFEEAGPGPTPFHGGFGLLNLESVKKPTYYVYQFLNELGNTQLINNDPAAIICKQNKNIQALIWDFTFPVKNNELDQDYFVKDQPPVARQPISLRINHVANGKYRVEVYRVGYGFNDPYTNYIKWGSPSYLPKQKLEELNQISSGKPVEVSEINITNGTFSKQLPIRSNDIYFVKLVSAK